MESWPRSLVASRLIIALVILVSPLASAAQDASGSSAEAARDFFRWEIHFGGLSHHWRNDDEYNDTNPGLGVEYRPTAETGVIAGFYRNSERRDSEYLFVRYQPFHYGPFHLGAIGGVVNHYDTNNGDFAPAAMVAASVDLGHLEIAVVAAPNVGSSDGCISVQFGLRF
ncbi:MAG TPA: hypothetical protein VED47_04425 [Burkholderiaceae bacterium]|nr:hypothetical protein [Burkholderiaceae bacterium]